MRTTICTAMLLVPMVLVRAVHVRAVLVSMMLVSIMLIPAAHAQRIAVATDEAAVGASLSPQACGTLAR